MSLPKCPPPPHHQVRGGVPTSRRAVSISRFVRLRISTLHSYIVVHMLSQPVSLPSISRTHVEAFNDFVTHLSSWLEGLEEKNSLRDIKKEIALICGKSLSSAYSLQDLQSGKVSIKTVWAFISSDAVLDQNMSENPLCEADTPLEACHT